MSAVFWQKLKRPYYLAGLTALFLLIGFFLTLNLLNFDRLPYGIAINNFKIGGANFVQAQEILKQQIASFESQKLKLTFGNESWLLSPKELGISIDSEQTLANAKNFGHGSNLLAATAEQSTALFSQKNIAPIYQVDSAQFKQALSSLSSIEKTAVNASLEYDRQEKNFSLTPAATGRAINRIELVKNVIQNFGQPDQTVYLALVEQEPEIKEENLGSAKNAAQILIDNAPYVLQGEDSQTWKVEKDTLGDWIKTVLGDSGQGEAAVSLDQEKIKVFLAPIAKSINREATSAKLTWENNEIKFILLAQPGQKLNLEKSIQKITDDILAGLAATDQAPKKNIPLVIEKTAPGVSDQNVKELGLTSLLGKGESNFAGSASNRQHNIKVGAQKLNGWLIKPGEEFSFVNAIGEIDGANGWVEGLIIKNNQTIPEYGGGICQVSTTLFRAAVNSGLKITERQPHAYPISYYNPPGFDATIYPPRPDLKFKNNTGGHLLLQNKIVGTKLFFEIYGQSDGRQVKIKGPTVLSKNPDGSMKTILTQEIWRDGALVEKNDFRSNYKSPDLYPIVTASPSPTPSASP